MSLRTCASVSPRCGEQPLVDRSGSNLPVGPCKAGNAGDLAVDRALADRHALRRAELLERQAVDRSGRALPSKPPCGDELRHRRASAAAGGQPSNASATRVLAARPTVTVCLADLGDVAAARRRSPPLRSPVTSPAANASAMTPSTTKVTTMPTFDLMMRRKKLSMEGRSSVRKCGCFRGGRLAIKRVRAASRALCEATDDRRSDDAAQAGGGQLEDERLARERWPSSTRSRRQRRRAPGVDVAVAVPFTLIAPAAERVPGAARSARRTCTRRTAGAHTGCVSAAMVSEAGARFTIVGHSRAPRRPARDQPRRLGEGGGGASRTGCA